MRISTAQLFTNTLATLRQKQTQLADLQTALATGKRVSQPADDPIGAGRILQVRALTDRLAQYQSNLNQADARLVLEESTLDHSGDVLDRAREIVLASLNGINDSETLAIYAGEVRQLREQLLSLANTQDANGEYLFAGTRSLTRPFSPDASGAVAYLGNAEQRFVNISDNLTVAMTDPGGPIFMEIPTGNGTFAVADAAVNTGTGLVGAGIVIDPSAWVPDTYTVTFTAPDSYVVTDGGGVPVGSGNHADPGRIAFSGIAFELNGTPAAGDQFTVSPATPLDLFASLDNLTAALTSGSATMTSTARANALNRALAHLDQGLSVHQNLRARIGSRLKQVDVYRDLNSSQFTQARAIQSSIEDLDYAQAISDFEFQSTTLDAAQKTFLALQNLSLFRLLR